ncbi:hypothetical protein D3C71_1234090 [compost metagenome]
MADGGEGRQCQAAEDDLQGQIVAQVRQQQRHQQAIEQQVPGPDSTEKGMCQHSLQGRRFKRRLPRASHARGDQQQPANATEQCQCCEPTTDARQQLIQRCLAAQ